MSLRDLPTLADAQRTPCASPKPSRLDTLATWVIAKRASSNAGDAFRRAVWKRDGYTCQACGIPVRRTLEFCQNKGEVHHRRGRNVAPQDRYNVDQAVLLCVGCHVKAQRHEITV